MASASTSEPGYYVHHHHHHDRPESMIIILETDSFVSEQPGPGRTLNRFIGALADRLERKLAQRSNGRPRPKSPSAPKFDYEVEWSGSHDTLLTLESSSTASDLPGPGRTLGKFIAKTGDRTSDYINFLVEKLGMGPNTVVRQLLKEPPPDPSASGKERKEALKAYKKLLSFLSVQEASSQTLVINQITQLIAQNFDHRYALLDLGAEKIIENLLYMHSRFYGREQRDILLASSKRALFCLSDVKLNTMMKEIHGMEYTEESRDDMVIGEHLRHHVQGLFIAAQHPVSLILASSYLSAIPRFFSLFCLEYLISIGVLDTLSVLLTRSVDPQEWKSYALVLHSIIDALVIYTRQWYTVFLSEETRTSLLGSLFDLLDITDPSDWSAFGLDKFLRILTRPIELKSLRFTALWRRDIVKTGGVVILASLQKRARMHMTHHASLNTVLWCLQPDTLESVIDDFEVACMGTSVIDCVVSGQVLLSLFQRLQKIWNANHPYKQSEVAIVMRSIASRNKYCRHAFYEFMDTYVDACEETMFAIKRELESLRPKGRLQARHLQQARIIGCQASSSKPYPLYMGRAVCDGLCGSGAHLCFGTLHGDPPSYTLPHDGVHLTALQMMHYYDSDCVLWLDHYDETPLHFAGHTPVLAGRGLGDVKHYVACAYHEEDLKPVLAQGVTQSLYSSISWYPCTITEGATFAEYMPEPNGISGTKTSDNFLGNRPATQLTLESCARTPLKTTRFRVLVLADETEDVVLDSKDKWGRNIMDTTGPVYWSSNTVQPSEELDMLFKPFCY